MRIERDEIPVMYQNSTLRTLRKYLELNKSELLLLMTHSALPLRLHVCHLPGAEPGAADSRVKKRPPCHRKTYVTVLGRSFWSH